MVLYFVYQIQNLIKLFNFNFMKQLYRFTTLINLFLMPISIFAQQAPPPPPSAPKHRPASDPRNPVFTIVEQMPSFPDGEKALSEYLSKNVKYPEASREYGLPGTVYIGFIVEKDGSLSNIAIKRGLSGGCSEEAMRVIETMPKWIPGRQQGKMVRVAFTLPIKFNPY
jgi:TonB family protein